jgi:DNA-binding MarR family transcriptional regulator
MRHAVLLQLQAALPASLPASTVWQGLQLAGFGSLSREALLTVLDYLMERGFVAMLPSQIDASLKRYKLTAAGTDYLEGECLI